MTILSLFSIGGFGGSVPLTSASYICCYYLFGSFKKKTLNMPKHKPKKPIDLKQALHPILAIMITLRDEIPDPRYGAAVRIEVAVETLFYGK